MSKMSKIEVHYVVSRQRKKVDNLPLPSFPPVFFFVFFSSHLSYSSTYLYYIMGVEKKTLVEGNGVDYPKKGEHVAIHYTGCLYDAEKVDNHCMGNLFDTSHKPGRGPLATPIGVGRLIRGWDEGVPQMSLGEKAILTISSDYGYGDRGFPGLIPANSKLVFEVELLKVGTKSV
ncbi:hypothetical protein N7465_010978 [Penicillium sp. CMV-2018d]|nr:hypothetical protein N7465_010978 [Penicillium sp. CMV-2018d]